MLRSRHATRRGVVPFLSLARATMRPLRIRCASSTWILLVTLVGCHMGMRGDGNGSDVVDTDDEPNPETWRCVDDGRRCSCALPEACGFATCQLGPGMPVPYCGPYEVCTLTAPARCLCKFLEESESAPTGQRVSSCPADDDGAPRTWAPETSCCGQTEACNGPRCTS